MRPGGGSGLGGNLGGNLGGGAASLPGGGFANRPAPGMRPGQMGQAGGGLGGSRPTTGGMNRPTTLPGQLGPGGAATLPGQVRPGVGSTKPFPTPGGGGLGGSNRPSLGGDRPGIGGDRPGGFDRPGIAANRPGIGGNRPGIGNGIGNNVGSNNNIGNNLSGGNSFNNFNVNGGGYGGGWGYPGGFGGGYGNGYGGGWANNWNSGFVNPAHNGWYSGCWNGNWGNGYGGGWWSPLAFGAATWGVSSLLGGWGLGYGSLGYGGGAYENPYYSSMPATVVASQPYDYSQPVVVNNYITNDGDLSNSSDAQGGAGGAAADDNGAAAVPVNNEANKAVDEALAKFKAGDYAAALAGFDRAVKLSPKDSVIHEVRALTLFALGRYPEAAATLNSVLVSAPGMDWTTISNVYGSVDAYTAHLRKLEDYCRTNPDSASGHFVLGYHYLVGGHADMAAEALKVVVAKQPGDMVAKRLLDAITPPEEPQADQSPTPSGQPAAAATTPAGPETDLVGTWKAVSGKDTVILTITEDSKFTWQAAPSGRPPVEMTGTIETASDAISLNTEKSGSMAGKVKSKGADAFDFSLVGAPKEAKPLEFQRQK